MVKFKMVFENKIDEIFCLTDYETYGKDGLIEALHLLARAIC